MILARIGGPGRLSDEARASRRPRPPAERVDVLWDACHKQSTKVRPAKSVKVRTAK